MKRVFVYIGSRARRASKTFEYITNVLNKTIEMVGKENIKIDLYMSGCCNINNCNGCNNCFFAGKCPQDKVDDMEAIKAKMLEADLVILASPVYLHNVSGDMKIFIDRISYWTHLMRLAGKSSIAIATSTGNGLDIVSNYLKKVLTYLGTDVVGSFGIVGQIKDDKYYNDVQACADLIKDCIEGKEVKSNPQLELIFKVTKESIKEQKELDSAEYDYWEKSGMLACNSFEEVINMNR